MGLLAVPASQGYGEDRRRAREALTVRQHRGCSRRGLRGLSSPLVHFCFLVYRLTPRRKSSRRAGASSFPLIHVLAEARLDLTVTKSVNSCMHHLQIEVSPRPLLQCINLLGQLTELRGTFYLPDHWFLAEEGTSGTAAGRAAEGQACGEGTQLPCPLQGRHSPRMSTRSSTQNPILWGLYGGFVTFNSLNELNHWQFMSDPNFSPSPLPGGHLININPGFVERALLGIPRHLYCS